PHPAGGRGHRRLALRRPRPRRRPRARAPSGRGRRAAHALDRLRRGGHGSVTPRPERAAVPLALALGGILLVAAGSGPLQRLADPLAQPTAPATALGSAKLRAALTRLGALALQPPTAEEVAVSAASGECPDYRIRAAPLAPEAQPGAVSAPPGERERWPVLFSLWVDPCRLAWLYAHPWDRGRAAEQPGWLAVYEQGRLAFASPVGVRIHGGVARDYPPYSFRLYFRGDY